MATHPDPAGVGKKGSRLGSFPCTTKSLHPQPKSLRPQPKSHQLQAWWIPEQAGPGAHGGSALPCSILAKLAQPGPTAPAGSGTQCHRGGHTGTQRQGQKLPAKAWPEAGGGRWHRTAQGELQYGKSWKRLPGPRKEARHGPEGGRGAKHAGIFVLSSPGGEGN